ncbi:MAG: hypothetical protein MUE69_19745 [Myxococcota bacterium]|nr:hypothetical protein [Myxococcota bacterium]
MTRFTTFVACLVGLCACDPATLSGTTLGPDDGGATPTDDAGPTDLVADGGVEPEPEPEPPVCPEGSTYYRQRQPLRIELPASREHPGLHEGALGVALDENFEPFFIGSPNESSILAIPAGSRKRGEREDTITIQAGEVRSERQHRAHLGFFFLSGRRSEYSEHNFAYFRAEQVVRTFRLDEYRRIDPAKVPPGAVWYLEQVRTGHGIYALFSRHRSGFGSGFGVRLGAWGSGSLDDFAGTEGLEAQLEARGMQPRDGIFRYARSAEEMLAAYEIGEEVPLTLVLSSIPERCVPADGVRPWLNLLRARVRFLALHIDKDGGRAPDWFIDVHCELDGRVIDLPPQIRNQHFPRAIVDNSYEFVNTNVLDTGVRVGEVLACNTSGRNSSGARIDPAEVRLTIPDPSTFVDGQFRQHGRVRARNHDTNYELEYEVTLQEVE